MIKMFYCEPRKKDKTCSAKKVFCFFFLPGRQDFNGLKNLPFNRKEVLKKNLVASNNEDKS